jgi:hypothetical protein
MRYCWLAVALLSTLSLGQTSDGGQQKNGNTAGSEAASSPSPGSMVAPDAVVITINGLCDRKSPEGAAAPAMPQEASPGASGSAPAANAGCKTLVTRRQFEGVVDVLSHKASIEKRRRFARDYSELLLFAQQARQFGLDKDPDSQEFLQYKYSQALQVLLTSYLQSKANDISDAEVEKYYKDHPERFQEIALSRIFVPLRETKKAQADPDDPIEYTPADREAMQKVAEKIQREAVAGGNFEKLEAEAYKAAHVTQEEPPEVDLGDKWTIDNLPPEHKDRIAHMQPGEVSGLIVHPMGWQIFKVTAKRMIPLSEAKPALQSLRMKDAMQSLRNSIDPQLNDAYFSDPTDPAHTQPSAAK